jgi:ribosome-binding factor A
MSGIKRAERVGGEVLAVLAAVLRDGLKDPRVGPITITSVRVSDDLSVARINFVPLGGRGDSAEVVEGLESAKGYLRRQVGKRLRLRIVPDLRFHLDTHLDKAMEMTEVLRGLSEQRAVREREAAGAEE